MLSFFYQTHKLFPCAKSAAFIQIGILPPAKRTRSILEHCIQWYIDNCKSEKEIFQALNNWILNSEIY